MIVQEPVQAAIWHCLNHYAYSDAIFLAERLYAEVDTDEALFLLATCYYRAGKPRQAYSLLHMKGCRSSQCKYLFAQCCLDLNKLDEAESTLMGTSVLKMKGPEDMVTDFGDSACFAIQLLARICNRTERLAKASDAYKKSLKLNPFLWTSYESLCNMGEKIDPSKVFQLSHLDNLNACHGTNLLVQLVNQNGSGGEDSSDVSENSLSIFTSQSLQQSSTRSPSLCPVIRSTPELIHIDEGTPPCTVPPAPLASQSSRSKFSIAGRGILKGGPLSLSPLTPTFGILPLESPYCPADSQYSVAYITPSPPALLDEQKTAGKKAVITRRSQSLNPSKPSVFSQSGNVTLLSQVVVASPQASLQPASMVGVVNALPRRSSRLFSSSNSVKENNESSSKSRFASPKTPPRKTKLRTSKNAVNNNNNNNNSNNSNNNGGNNQNNGIINNSSQLGFNELNELNKSSEMMTPSENKPLHGVSASQQILNIQKSAADGLMQLLQELGRAYLHLSQFNCHKAMELFSGLSPHHLNTGWVLGNLGRAHFELSEYQQCVQYFTQLRNLEPHRVEGLEYYSTALWHLQKEVELSSLAQDLTEFDQNSPESWCAVGNCFSLQKEHDASIKFFQRAVQVAPNFAYAYTLLGHEYVITEELDKAMSCFRNAIRIDPRHYNAWYGIGMIYYKQEKFQFAEFHFKKALAINPQSSVLMCHIAVVQHASQKTEMALATLNQALGADPKNALCKFHRASIYFASDKHREALTELMELKEIVPKESLVYFLIGKVHKKLGNTHLALMNFSWAMDLDPKGANNQIKEEVDRRYANEDDEFAAGNEMAAAEASNVDGEELSHESLVMDAEDVQLQAMESDESL